jgi:hypothetical protein
MDDQEIANAEATDLPVLEETSSESSTEVSPNPRGPDDIFEDKTKTATYVNLLSKQIIIDGPDDDKRYLRVLSFFADYPHEFRGLGIKNENGANESVQAWGVIEMSCKLTSGERPDPKYADAPTGYNCIQDKILMDIFTAAILGFNGHVNVKKRYICMDPGFGGVSHCVVEYSDPDWEKEIHKICESAESARKACKEEVYKTKSELSARYDALAYFLKKYQKEQKKVQKMRPSIVHKK